MHIKSKSSKKDIKKPKSLYAFYSKQLSFISRHPYAVPFITFFVLLILTGIITLFVIKTHNTGIVPHQEIVIISYDHHKQVVPNKEPTVGALLNKLNIHLHPGDVVEPAESTPIKQDQFRINIYRAVPVEIVDGQKKTYTFSAATTPRSIAEQAGKTIYPNDKLKTVPVENFVTSQSIGEQVVIDRAKPINVNLYGTPLVIRTQAKTVGGLLKQANIHLASSDQVLPQLSAPIVSGSQVFIIRKGTKIESVSATIPMPVQTIEDPSLALGTSAIRQQGSPGQKVITYQDNTSNGVVISRNIIQTVISKQPVTQIMVEGTSLSGIQGDMALAGIAPSDYQYASYIISHESGWCPTKAQGETYCPALPDNPYTSLGYGLCQSTPGIKMASAGADWQTNPVTQLRWCSNYASSTYGGWYNAYLHWIRYRNW